MLQPLRWRQWHLTSHSSRTRFAGRLNSGVRPVRKFVAPETPEGMLQQLQELLPGFDHSWEDEDQWPGLGRSFHAVSGGLTDYFKVHCPSLTQRQLAAFAVWINGMVESGGRLENAVSTCFLEHSDQLGFYKVLAPHLTALAKASARA